jgi:hypothetical protein
MWLVPGVGEVLLGSRSEWGEQPRFSDEHRRRALQAYRIEGTRDALLRYTRGSIFESPDLRRAFASLDLPILQLHGARDHEVPHAAAVALNETLSTSQLVTFENGTHDLMFDFPECFASELSRFLEDAPGRDSSRARHRRRRCSEAPRPLDGRDGQSRQPPAVLGDQARSDAMRRAESRGDAPAWHVAHQ